MSFGWSVGDIIKLIELGNQVRDFCKYAPNELQKLSDRLERIRISLQRLQHILHASGVGSWNEAPVLTGHLARVENFLRPLGEAVRKDASPATRIVGLLRLARQQAGLKKIQESLDLDENAIREIRDELILTCTLKTLRVLLSFGEASKSSTTTMNFAMSIGNITDTRLGPSQHSDVAGHLDTGNSNLASETAAAVERALVFRSTCRRQAVPKFHSTTGTARDWIKEAERSNVITEIASLSEQNQLYSPHADSVSRRNGFASITNIAPYLNQAFLLGDGHKSSRSNSVQNLESPSLVVDFESYLHLNAEDETTQEHDFRRKLRLNDAETATLYFQKPGVIISDTPSVDNSSSQSSGHRLQAQSNNLIGNGASLASCSTSECEAIRFYGKARVRIFGSTLDLIDFQLETDIPGKTNFLRFLALSSYPGNLGTGNVAQPRYTKPDPLHEGASTGPSRYRHSFRHYIPSLSRPIPLLLHPIVEGPIHEVNEPYKVTFEEPQQIAQGDGTQASTVTTYILFDERDRKMICDKIFGKTLLLVAGCEEISVKSKPVAHICAILLWSDPISGALSITFNHNLISKAKPTAAKHAEYKIDPNVTSNKTSKENKRLALNIIAVTRDDDNELKRQGTSDSKTSTVSSGRFRRRSSSVYGEGKMECMIIFTDAKDRAIFVRHVEGQKQIK